MKANHVLDYWYKSVSRQIQSFKECPEPSREEALSLMGALTEFHNAQTKAFVDDAFEAGRASRDTVTVRAGGPIERGTLVGIVVQR